MHITLDFFPIHRVDKFELNKNQNGNVIILWTSFESWTNERTDRETRAATVPIVQIDEGKTQRQGLGGLVCENEYIN